MRRTAEIIEWGNRGVVVAFDADDLHLHGSLLHLAEPSAFRAWLRTLRHNWVVYAKRPFAGPEQALRYLGACPTSRRLGIPGCLLHPVQDGSLGDFVSKHLQIAVDTGGTPSVLLYHAKDELTQRLRCRFPAGSHTSARDPFPLHLESGAMPANHGLGMHKEKNTSPIGPESPQHDPEYPVEGAQARRGRRAAKTASC
jgi:hypothetical protein